MEKAVLGQAADKERTKDTPIATFNAAVKFHSQPDAVIVADNTNFFCKRVTDSNKATYNSLHL